MVTYVKTTYNQLETPSGAVGEAPDGPGAFQHLATNIDTRLGIGGAEYAVNVAAITAIPTARCFDGKLAYAADTKYLYRWTVPATGSPSWRIWQTPWANITSFGSNVIANSFGWPPSWSINSGSVSLAGMLSTGTGVAFTDGQTLLTMPAVAQPPSMVRFMVPGDAGGFAELQLAVGASVLSVQSTKSTAPKILGLDGFTYRIA